MEVKEAKIKWANQESPQKRVPSLAEHHVVTKRGSFPAAKAMARLELLSGQTNGTTLPFDRQGISTARQDGRCSVLALIFRRQ
jgi:hypothetical protein